MLCYSIRVEASHEVSSVKNFKGLKILINFSFLEYILKISRTAANIVTENFQILVHALK
jgi:hypothetical protein